MQQENECPDCRAAWDLAEKLAETMGEERPHIIIDALSNVLAAVLANCAPTLDDAMEENRRFHARTLNAVLRRHQEEGVPPIAASIPATSMTVN